MKTGIGLVLLFLTTAISNAAGFIVVDEAALQPGETTDNVIIKRLPPSPRRWAPLEVTDVRAEVRIDDQIANTVIHQEFYNPNSRQLEGTFLLPLPKGAFIEKFAMQIDGKEVSAELLNAEKARGIYEDIVRKSRDPALLEYAGRDLLKVRIFPIEPNSKKHITVSWRQLLKADGGIVQYALPLNTEKFSAKPVKNVSVKLELQSKRALKSIYSPSHKVEVKRHGEHKASVALDQSHGQADGDFQLLFSQEEGEFGADLLTYRSDAEDGYFLLLVLPSAEIKVGRVMPKDVVFVLDTSGSMAGAKLDQAKRALLFCVENLNDNDRFEVLRFSTEVEAVFDKLTDASEANRSRAEKFIKQLKPTGGTAIDEALRKALATRSGTTDRPFVIVFLTDGLPTVGVTDQEQILKNAARQNESNTRIFVFGIGTDVNTHLLDRISEQTKAFSQYVLPEEDIEVKVSSFFSKIKEPVLANLKLDFPEGVHVASLYPAPLPDLFKGEQLVIAGRYSGSGSGKLKIRGTANSKDQEFTYPVKFSGSAGADEHDFIPRLWATRRVGCLLDEIRLRGDNQELRDEVTELARKYNIVTPYTAYLIMEDEGRRGLTQNLRSLRLEEDNKVAREDLSKQWAYFGSERTGDLGVAGAQSTYTLKSAETPAAGVSGSVQALLRPHRSSGIAGPRPFDAAARDLSKTPAVRQETNISGTQSRFINGRTFYFNENTWVDSELQKATPQSTVTPITIKFGSPEYFALLNKYPQTRQWLALGTNVRFLFQGHAYQISE